MSYKKQKLEPLDMEGCSCVPLFCFRECGEIDLCSALLAIVSHQRKSTRMLLWFAWRKSRKVWANWSEWQQLDDVFLFGYRAPVDGGEALTDEVCVALREMVTAEETAMG